MDGAAWPSHSHLSTTGSTEQILSSAQLPREDSIFRGIQLTGSGTGQPLFVVDCQQYNALPFKKNPKWAALPGGDVQGPVLKHQLLT